MKRFLHRLYSRGSTNQRWVTRRFTPAGLLVVAGIVTTAAVGVDTSLSVAYHIFTLLAVLLAISLIFGLTLRPRLGMERILPGCGSVGEPVRYEFRVTNPTHRMQRGFVLFENLLDPRPSLDEFVHSSEPGEADRNWVDRQLLYFRWLWLIGQKQMARPVEVTMDRCPPHTTVTVPVAITPLRRGVLRFEGVTVGMADPLGLFRGLRTFPIPQSLLILPKRYALPPITLPGYRKYQRGGVALASSVGESEEFVSLRDYRPGDPVRHVHWRTWARLGRPVVKEFQDEFFVRHALVLDTFGSLELSAVFEEAVSVAASFACTLQTQDSLLDLMFVGAEAFCFTMGRGLAQVQQMLEVLAGVDLCPGRSFSSLHQLVLQHAGDLSGCVVILIQLDQERIDFIRQLQALGVSVMTLILVPADANESIQSKLRDADGIAAQVLEAGKVPEGLIKLNPA